MVLLTLFVVLGALGEDLLVVEVDAVAMEIVRLEEARPELGLRQVVRHVLHVLLTHCKTKPPWLFCG